MQELQSGEIYCFHSFKRGLMDARHAQQLNKSMNSAGAPQEMPHFQGKPILKHSLCGTFRPKHCAATHSAQQSKVRKQLLSRQYIVLPPGHHLGVQNLDLNHCLNLGHFHDPTGTASSRLYQQGLYGQGQFYRLSYQFSSAIESPLPAARV